jgi:hypothetical protein
MLQFPVLNPGPSGRGFTILGLGDITVPGLLIALALRFDRYRSSSSNEGVEAASTRGEGEALDWLDSIDDKTYFRTCLAAYCVGLGVTFGERLGDPLVTDFACDGFCMYTGMLGAPDSVRCYLRDTETDDVQRTWAEPPALWPERLSTCGIRQNWFGELLRDFKALAVLHVRQGTSPSVMLCPCQSHPCCTYTWLVHIHLAESCSALPHFSKRVKAFGAECLDTAELGEICKIQAALVLCRFFCKELPFNMLTLIFQSMLQWQTASLALHSQPCCI